MDAQASVGGNVETGQPSLFDVVVIGTGVAGLYQLCKLRELGLQVRVLEAGSAVGGPGIGTAIRARASIPKAIPMAIRFRRSSSTNGTGASGSHPRLRPSAISTMSPTSSTCGAIFSSAAALRRRDGTTAFAAGNSRWRMAAATSRAFW